MKTKKVPKTFFIPQNNYEQFGLQVYNLLVDNFSKTFFVGGMIRDLLLHKKISDIDITTSATPEQVIKLLQGSDYQLDSSHKSFGVIKVKSKTGGIEITTMRTEQYATSRYPKVKFTTSLLIDSKRRDFTANSLYFQAKANIIYDPQDGLQDINKKQIKIISDPKTKLSEDPLRIVRAYRFSKQLNFQFETKTKQALEKYFPLLKNISKSRIESEIKKSTNVTTKKYLQQKLKQLLI